MSSTTQQNQFLGDMQTIVRGRVESLTRYEIDGDNKGGSIWVSKPNSGKNPNNLGNELIKIKMPFEMFDQQKAKVEAGEITFPIDMEILCEVNMGGQNKAVLNALSLKVIKPEPEPESTSQSGKILDENIDKTTGEIMTDTDKAKTATGSQSTTRKP